MLPFVLALIFGVVILLEPVRVLNLFGAGKTEILEFVALGIGGDLLALQVLISNKRAKALEVAASAQAKATERQAEANRNTEEGQRQERFKNAIEHLGHQSDSVRLGGAYELVHLAEDIDHFRRTVLDILCAHIRRTTREDTYQEQHQEQPSEEAQSLLALLFVEKIRVFKDFEVNLTGSWLIGSNLRHARLKWANFRHAQLQEANLRHARLQGANLWNAQLQGANLTVARLQGANAEVLLYSVFEELIRSRINQESPFRKAVFGGGLSEEDIDNLVEGLDNEEANSLRERLKLHIGLPPNHELPEGSGAITGTYTKEEAEKWIDEYRKAVSEGAR